MGRRWEAGGRKRQHTENSSAPRCPMGTRGGAGFSHRMRRRRQRRRFHPGHSIASCEHWLLSGKTERTTAVAATASMISSESTLCLPEDRVVGFTPALSQYTLEYPSVKANLRSPKASIYFAWKSPVHGVSSASSTCSRKQPQQACYFGHANCARILIMVGADISAKDCYGNSPSRIFDDHVTEPVLDEVRDVRTFLHCLDPPTCSFLMYAMLRVGTYGRTL